MAQTRKTTTKKGSNVVSTTKSPKKTFYIILGLAAVVGIAALSYMASRGTKNRIITVDANLPPVTSQGYVLGSPTAPLELIEFGDFECPQCARYAELTEPDVRARYVNTGKIRFRYIDYPLPMHANTLNASNAAACADEQGKFWEMHDLLYATQHEWNAQATSDPDKYFKALSAQITGLDGAKLGECIESRRMMPKVQSHLKMANDRAVPGTPTFYIGNKQFGNMSADEFSRVLDAELAAAAPAGAATRKP